MAAPGERASTAEPGGSPEVPFDSPGRSDSSGGARVRALDAVRGLAVCGILLVNIPQITQMRNGPEPGVYVPAEHWLQLLVQQRFFPVFSFLFGLSFAIFLDGAARRASLPRVVLLRRMAALGVLGALHQFLQPGEALLPYAIVGIVVLLPASWLPRVLVLLAGVLGTVAAVSLTHGGTSLLPGLFLLGLATARYGVHNRFDRPNATVALVFVLSLAAAAPLLYWQSGDIVRNSYSHGAVAAGLLLASAYVTGLLLLLRTRVGPAVSALLEPLGRMALTNYLTATLLVVALAPVLGLPHSLRFGPALALAAGIIGVQVLWSRWWLRRFRYGPFEWLWRCVTWWSPVSPRGTG
ncbi:Uncharacterized membrane protein YeiB [Actinopolyspora xinjiangensis]|uniref:Uncharacterized membrane protein YeiB n=1 Tax=Actinopolyspora xinjiangensis TaxID=405564 RepID=A0A1H0VDT8_9ACTN|nr:Uncharacterized membrane protein YeiB [Actinopolyspora xinjiangensis]